MKVKKMMHAMRLAEEPFGWVKEGKMSIETRLFDEKRRKVEIGDMIVFSKLNGETETVCVRVKALLRFECFQDFFKLIPKDLLGHGGLVLEQQVSRMRKYYSEEEEKKFGVLGIWFEVIK